LRYAEFAVPLVKAVGELSKQNDELKKQNEKSQRVNAAQKKLTDELALKN